MAGFNFEKNLNHQSQGVNSILSIFEHLVINEASGAEKRCINPVLDKNDKNYFTNIVNTQKFNNIGSVYQNKATLHKDSNIIDIMMETGTGKTYTYAKTIFELNKSFGIFKFIVVVPTLSIKAGTIDFLKSDSSVEHFKEQYGKVLKLHIVESKKITKNKKSIMHPAVNSFVTAGNFDKGSIQVMVINAGMINSDSMQKSLDKGLFDKYSVPFDGIAATNPFLIIDEPHKFGQNNKTWDNINKMNPQFILRYGATFHEFENLVYVLSAVDSFNKNLVKGVIGYITEYETGKNVLIKLLNTNGKEASFELNENSKTSKFKLAKKESLKQIHLELTELYIESINKTKVVLSNGLELKRGDSFNPYSYAEKLQVTMMQKAIQHHFELEKELLTRDVRIKPITLFFIDNIEEYRNNDGYIKEVLEQFVGSQAKELLKTESNPFYKEYLEKTLENLSLTHAGYFSKDNSDKDDAIEQEINEILHDKQAMLDLKNPRRFIFSKWTLREGWDNPNVFQICKLRSSGSEISKLQEVGRGLRLPVNEYGNRVKDEQFYLNYFVDFTENDFVDKLVNEINEMSGANSFVESPIELTQEIIDKICEIYDITEDDLLLLLDENNVITRSNQYKEGGYSYIKKNYSLVFSFGVDKNKIRKSTDVKKKLTVRTEKYDELKELWEKLNEKVILEYGFDDETQFKTLITDFFSEQKGKFKLEGIKERKSTLKIEDNRAFVSMELSVLDNDIVPIATMKYSNFLEDLSKALQINIKTIHSALIDSGVDINKFLNETTIRIIKQNFNNYLMFNAIDKFSIEYKKVSNSIHPTKFTDVNGQVLNEILASDVGVFADNNTKVADSYLLNEMYFDSELEKENIESEISEVIVFTKIPKNSIKIPVAGGKSYSPDFAYVVNFKGGKKKLHFIVETKNVEGDDNLRREETQKIRHAEQLFKGTVKIDFKTQFSNNMIHSIIEDIIKEEIQPT
jgi:type III restriction enzyme